MRSLALHASVSTAVKGENMFIPGTNVTSMHTIGLAWYMGLSSLHLRLSQNLMGCQFKIRIWSAYLE